MISTILTAEVELYDRYLRGGFCGYRIFKVEECFTCKHSEEEEVDSCWGYESEEAALEAAKEYLDHQPPRP
jgi:hypothetical protein